MASEENRKPFHADAILWDKLKPLARQMRHTPTLAEDTLWQELRNRHLNRVKFRRQYAIERFIVDFICLEHKVIIEVDGSVHDQQQEYDAVRQQFLESLGFLVLRFTNDAVLHHIALVRRDIINALDSRNAPPTVSPPLHGGAPASHFAAARQRGTGGEVHYRIPLHDGAPARHFAAAR